VTNEILFPDGYVVRVIYRLLKPGKYSEYAESFVVFDPAGNIVAGGAIDGTSLNETYERGGKDLR